MGQTPTVLIICHANTCRSIIAEALLKRLLEEQGPAGNIRVLSGGVAPYARDGALVSMDARLVLRDEGIHISPESVSTDLRRNRHMVAEADLILAMTDAQIDMLRREFPDSHAIPTYTLKTFSGIEGDIEDPVGRGEDVYAACLTEIKGCIDRALPRLLGDLAPAARALPRLS